MFDICDLTNVFPRALFSRPTLAVFLSFNSNKAFGGTAEQLRAFDINIAPPQDVWVLVDKENAIWFMQVRTRNPQRALQAVLAKSVPLLSPVGLSCPRRTPALLS